MEFLALNAMPNSSIINLICRSLNISQIVTCILMNDFVDNETPQHSATVSIFYGKLISEEVFTT